MFFLDSVLILAQDSIQIDAEYAGDETRQNYLLRILSLFRFPLVKLPFVTMPGQGSNPLIFEMVTFSNCTRTNAYFCVREPTALSIVSILSIEYFHCPTVHCLQN